MWIFTQVLLVVVLSVIKWLGFSDFCGNWTKTFLCKNLSEAEEKKTQNLLKSQTPNIERRINVSNLLRKNRPTFLKNQLHIKNIKKTTQHEETKIKTNKSDLTSLRITDGPEKKV